MGYFRAGFTEIVGVDIKPQPRYPFTFVQADAMTYSLAGFDAIHASPPCQHYSTATAEPGRHPDLYVATRRRLEDSGLPWVIENVIGAPCQYGLMLCGTMFGLEADGEWLRRHRTFETPFLIMRRHRCAHRKDRRAITVTGKCFLTVTKDCARHSRQSTFKTAQSLMGIDWMNRRELPQAIPPAYTEYIGKQLLEAFTSRGHAP